MEHMTEVPVQKDMEWIAGDFQLTELEQRLEMAAIGGATTQSIICCNCIWGSYCIEV